MTLTAARPTGGGSAPDLEALFKEARRRRRRRQELGVLVVAALVLGAVVAHVALRTPTGSSSSSLHTTTTPPRTVPSGTPAEIVGWTSTHNVVVISTPTGHV